MDIILDTNIYKASFSLGGPRWEALEAYLQKTQDQLVIPYVIRHEVLSHYRADIKAAIKNLKTSLAAFGEIAVAAEHKELIASIDAIPGRNDTWLDEQAANYLVHITTNFRTVVLSEVPALDLKPIVDRALNKVRPFNENGVGFKDAVIWGSLLSYAKTQGKTPIVFISNNSKDFGKQQLFEHLEAEAKALGVEVKYYNKLEDFIRENFDSIRDVNVTIEDIDLVALEALIEKKVKEDDRETGKLLRDHSTRNVHYHSVQGVHNTVISAVEDVVIKDISPDFKYVHATLLATTDVVCVGDHYREYTDRYGDFDYDAYQDLEDLSTPCVIDITMKLKGDTTSFEELEVAAISFP